MKVLEINSVCGIRSTGRICTDIAASLIDKGHKCIIAYGREAVPVHYKDITYKIGTELDIRLHGVISRLFDASGFGSTSATKNFIAFIKEYDPDVIHLHNIHGYYLNVEILFDYLKTCGKRIIWTMHDCWAFTGHCTYFSSIGCDKWRDGCEKCPQKKRYPSSLFFDNSRANYLKKCALFKDVPNMTLVTPSKWLAELAGASFLKNYPIRVINNGIDTDAFKPCKGDFRKRFGLTDKFIILGVSSVWDRLKGFDDFLALSKIISEEYHIVLVGLKKEQAVGLPNNITAVYRTNSTVDLAEIYSDADVFVNFTYEDNYPTVNLEAQSCGTPVITYSTGGSVESVPERNAAAVGDVAGVFEKIKNRDYEAADKHTDFGKKAFTDKYLKLYSDDEYME